MKNIHSKIEETSIPSHNLHDEYEINILGALLIDPSLIRDIKSILKPSDFNSEKHQNIYRSILFLAKKNIPVDLLTVRENLEKNNVLESSGGSLYLTYLTELVITGADLHYHANKVKEAANKRKWKEQAQQIIYAVDTGDDDSLEKLGPHILSDYIPNRKVLAEYPNPMSEAAFNGMVSEIVSAIDPHTEADPVALLINTLTFFGNSIGPQPHIKVGADKHTSRLFTTLVGVTSNARKGSSVSPIKELFNEIDHEWTSQRIQGGLSSGEGVIQAVHDEIRQQKPIKDKGCVVGYEDVVIHNGINDKRLLTIEPELPRVLKVMTRDGNVLSPVIREAWDSGNLQSMTKNSPIRATGAHISIISHTTSEELLKYLHTTEFTNGFCNRFLWICVKRSKLLPFGGNFEISRLSPVLNKLRQAYQFAKSVDIVTWADETRPYWESIYPDLSGAKPGIVGALLARAEAQVIRLALIYTLLDCKNKIEICHLKSALAVWGYSEDSVRFIFKNVIGDSVAERILKALKDNPQGLTRTQISNVLGRHYNTERINQALDTLRNSDLAMHERNDTGGRPVERWFVVDITEKEEKNAK